MTGFIIGGISPEPWRDLFGASDAVLGARNVVRMRADAKPGFPCRVSLRDAEVGDILLLVNYDHHPAANPYRSRHAIFVAEGASEPARFVDAVPDSLGSRLISLRAYDADDMMTDAECVAGAALLGAIARMFADGRVAYLHAHNAARGCFAARVDRAAAGT